MAALTKHKQGFYWEASGDPENCVTALVDREHGLSITVSDEQAVDSYNETFECTAYLTREDARRLRDYLNSELKD